MKLLRFFQGWRQREVLLVLLLGVLSLVLWRVPVAAMLFYPFQLLGTFVHEISHGLAAILTGGNFVRFEVHPDLSGLAWSAGGIRLIVTSAGYVGSALFGGLLVLIAARGVPANTVLLFLGIVLGLLCLVFVRNLFGIFSGLILAGLLLLAGSRLNAFWADGLLLFLAVQLMLDAIDNVFDLIWLSVGHSGVLTDAQIMQDLTLIPAPFWAVLWSIISLVVLAASLSLAYRRPLPPPPA